MVSVTLAGSAFVALWLVLPQGVEQQPATLDTIVRFEGPGPRDAELEAVIRQYGPGPPSNDDLRPRSPHF